MASTVWTCEDHGYGTVIVHTDKDCPICTLQKDKENLEAKIEDLESTIESLKDDISDLESEKS